MNDVIKKICQKHGLHIIEWFNAGNICDTVCKVRDTKANVFVLKIGSEKRSIDEIIKNNTGYAKMRESNLSWIIPEILAQEICEEYAYMLMEYCGDNFLKQSKIATDPKKLYHRLIRELEKLYNQSLKNGLEAKTSILLIVDKVIEQYEKYIYMYLDKERNWVEKLIQVRENFENTDLIFYCFSNWDFTPEDVYLTPLGLKYSDPHENIFGIPIIDLACFSGVARDAYKLPGSKEGYQLLKEFALQKVSAILHINEDTAQQMFYLGRILQCLLSIRFRIEIEPEKARILFNKSGEYLEKII